MNYQAVLEEIKEEVRPFFGKGRVADYIPALKRVDSTHFAMSLQFFDGSFCGVGEVDCRFSIQSISKVFTYAMVLPLYQKELYKRISHEPSGNPFNSLVQLEYEKGIPRNPFITS